MFFRAEVMFLKLCLLIVMVTSRMAEAVCGEVVITDSSKEVFESFLNYLYLNTLESKKFEARYDEMLYLAEKYLVHGLRMRCIREMEEMVEPGNLIYLLKMADAFNIESLAAKVVDVMSTNCYEDFFEADWDQLSTDYRISVLVLSKLPSSTVSMNWTGAFDPYCISQYALNKSFRMRNNGNNVEVRIDVLYEFGTVCMSLRDFDIWDRPIEISYSVDLIVRNSHHSTSGNHWWPAHPSRLVPFRYQERRRVLIQFTYDSLSVEVNFDFYLKITHWDRPNKVFKKPDCTGKPELPKPLSKGEQSNRSITPSAMDVAKRYSAVKAQCANRITRSTYQKLRQHWSTGAMPNESEVDLTLIYAAREHSCTDLQHHCEKVLASRSHVDNAVETLVLAEKMDLKVLESETAKFIGLHHLEVMDTSKWKSLENHPNLVASILRNVLSKPPDFEPISNESFPKLTLPGDRRYSDDSIDDYFY